MLRPASSATPSADAKTSAEAAIIAGAASQPPAHSSPTPISAVTIVSAAIGGVVIVTLIIVVSVIVMRWRAARQEEESGIQGDSVGKDYSGSIGSLTRTKGSSDNGSLSTGVQVQDEEAGMQMSGGAGPPQIGRDMVEVGRPNGFAVMDRSRDFPRAAGLSNISRGAAENPFQSPLSSPRWRAPNGDRDRDQDKNTGPSMREYNRASEPFSRRISLSPFDSPFDNHNGHDEELDSPTKGHFDERGSEWSNATLTTDHQGDLPHFGQSRGVSALDREVDLIRSRYSDAQRVREGGQSRSPSGNTGLRAPPTVETSSGMRFPAAALERRVSSTSLDTMDSETFQKLLFDVQSGPF